MVLRSKMTAAPSNRIFAIAARFVRTYFTQLHFPQSFGKFDGFAEQNDGNAVKSDFRGSCRMCSHIFYAAMY
jgi:hypothetical protein